MLLTGFFQALETNFPLCGVRAVLAKQIGADATEALERVGIFSLLRIADTYPCPQPSGAGCPRRLVETTRGAYIGICGNEPAECSEVRLTPKDVEWLGVVPERLLEQLRPPLHLSGAVRKLEGLAHAYQAGFFIPQPAVKHPVFFTVAVSASAYAMVIDVLRSRAEGAAFAVLTPTDRFVSPDTVRQCRLSGIPLFSLAETMQLSPAGKFEAVTHVLDVFATIGKRTATPVRSASDIVADVLTADGWQSLTEPEYRHLLSTAGRYQIFADERTRTAHKLDGRRRTTTGIQPSYFRMVRKATEVSGRFDPGVNGLTDEQLSGKQIFQRARKAIDLERASGWALFKTELIDDHAEYVFRPDADITFALIFLPKS